MLAKSEDITSAFAKFRSQRRTAPVPVEARSEDTPTKVTARLNFTSVGVCPYCSEPMGRVTCCDQEVFLCENDRFVSPLPNEEIRT